MAANERQKYLESRFYKFYTWAKKVLNFLWIVTFGEAIALTPLRVFMAFMTGTFVTLVTSAPWLVFLGMVGAAVVFGVLRWVLEQYKESQEAKLSSYKFALKRVAYDTNALGVSFKPSHGFISELQKLANHLYGENFYQVVVTSDDPEHLTLKRKESKEENKKRFEPFLSKASKKGEEATAAKRGRSEQYRNRFKERVFKYHETITNKKQYQAESMLIDKANAFKNTMRRSTLLRFLKHGWNFLNRYSMYFWWMMMISMVLFTASIAALSPLFVLLVPAILPGIFLVKEVIKILTKPYKNNVDDERKRSEKQIRQDCQALLQEWVYRQHIKALKERHQDFEKKKETLKELIASNQKEYGEFINTKEEALANQVNDSSINTELYQKKVTENFFAVSHFKHGLRYAVKFLAGLGLGYLIGCFIPWPFLVAFYLMGFSWVLSGAATIALFLFATVVGLCYALSNVYDVFKANRERDAMLYSDSTRIPGFENILLSDYANELQKSMEQIQAEVIDLTIDIKRLEAEYNHQLNRTFHKQAKNKYKIKREQNDNIKLVDLRPLTKDEFLAKAITIATFNDRKRQTGLSWTGIFLLESLIKAIDAEGAGIFFVRSVAMPGMFLTVVLTSLTFNLSLVFHIALLLGALWVGLKIAELVSDYQQKREQELLEQLASRVRNLEKEYTVANDLVKDLREIKQSMGQLTNQLKSINHTLFEESYNYKNFFASFFDKRVATNVNSSSISNVMALN